MLLGYFDPRRPDLDPWWWPRNDGSDAEDWGLHSNVNASSRLRSVLKSLRAGPGGGQPGSRADYTGFLGSVGPHRADCFWILSSRPSSAPYPNPKGSTTKLVKLLQASDLLGQAYVTDFIKFRGAGPDAQALRGVDKKAGGASSPTETLWRVSLKCLVAEWKGHPGKRILIAGGKAGEFWAKASEEAIAEGGDVEETIRAMSPLVRPVPSWMARQSRRNIKEDWLRALG